MKRSREPAPSVVARGSARRAIRSEPTPDVPLGSGIEVVSEHRLQSRPLGIQHALSIGGERAGPDAVDREDGRGDGERVAAGREPQPELPVLGPSEPRVEAADLGEHGATDGRRPIDEVPRDQLAEQLPGIGGRRLRRLDGGHHRLSAEPLHALGPEPRVAVGHRGVGPRVQSGTHGTEIGREPEVVGVEEAHVPARRRLDAGVPRRGEAGVRLLRRARTRGPRPDVARVAVSSVEPSSTTTIS